MKTLTVIPTLLALTIQVMVVGQTQGNQARKIRMDISAKKEIPTRFETKPIASVLINSVDEFLMYAEKSDLKFLKNKSLINQCVLNLEQSKLNYTKEKVAITESEFLFKLSLQLRQDGFMQQELHAQLENLTLAEAKENEAIAKQQQIFQLFEKEYPQVLATFLEQAYQQNNLQVVKLMPTIVYDSGAKEDVIVEKESNLKTELKQADGMIATAELLKQKASNALKNEKKEMLMEAKILENDSKYKQIEASNVLARELYTNYDKNRMVISNLLTKYNNATSLKERAIILNNDAEFAIKMGKELRAEANKQITRAAIHGALSNAEEKENSAIAKQAQALKLLGNTQEGNGVAIK